MAITMDRRQPFGALSPFCGSTGAGGYGLLRDCQEDPDVQMNDYSGVVAFKIEYRLSALQQGKPPCEACMSLGFEPGRTVDCAQLT